MVSYDLLRKHTSTVCICIDASCGSCSYVNKYIVAWRKIKRRLWRLPYTTHNNIVHNLSNDVAFQLDKRIVCFIHNALNHSNKVCRYE